MKEKKDTPVSNLQREKGRGRGETTGFRSKLVAFGMDTAPAGTSRLSAVQPEQGSFKGDGDS